MNGLSLPLSSEDRNPEKVDCGIWACQPHSSSLYDQDTQETAHLNQTFIVGFVRFTTWFH